MRMLFASILLLPVLAVGQAPPQPDEPRPVRPFRPPAQPGLRPDAVQPMPPGAPSRPVGGPAASKPPGRGVGETLRPESKCIPLHGRFMLTFNRADIVDVLEQASRWTCRNFVYTEEIARGKITLLSKTPVTADEAYAAFLAALNSNNISVYATGKYYKLIRTTDAKKNPIPLYTDTETGAPANEQPVTKVIRLSFSDPDQMRAIVSNFISPQGADVVAIPPDMLIITDIGLNIRRIEKILASVDHAGAGDLVRIVQVRYASARDIAEKVNQIFQAQGRGKRTTIAAGPPSSAGRPPSVPAAPAAGGGPVEVSVSKIIPDERTNKLIIIADEKSFQRILELIDQLDVPTTGEGGIHVVFLRHANAEELAQTLSNLAQGQARGRTQGAPGGPGSSVLPTSMPGQPAGTAPGQPARPTPTPGPPPGGATAELFSGEVKITADKAQNALLIQASASDFAAIQRLIDQLDRARRQVFVEAVIMEVNLRDENQFGVGGHTTIPFKYKGDTGVIPIASEPGRVSSLSLASAVQLGGFLTGFVGPVSAELSKLGLTLPSLGVLIQALQSSSDVNVLSTPHLVATDNEESEIVVGQNVPFQAGYAPPGLSSLLSSAGTTGTTAGATTAATVLGIGGLSSLYAPIQRQPVELRLKIKPQINEGGNVRLQIEEQTEEIASNDPVLGPTTSKRSVKTQIVARDESTIVIGGLIQERTVRSVKKVPFFGSLPILGWLFRDSVTTKSKTNLLLFLTPYIIRDEADYRRIYEKKRKEQEQFMEQFYGRQPSYQVDVDFERKAGPFSHMRAAVFEETSKLENGGPGAPGEHVTQPPGAPAAPPTERPRPPAEVTPQEEGKPEGKPIDRLEVQPAVPAPGAAPPPAPPSSSGPEAPAAGSAPAPEEGAAPAQQ